MSALTVEEKNDPDIKHALKIRSAWSLSNYHSFFQLYSTAPNMGGYLLDLFVQRERERAIKTLIKSWVISFVVLTLNEAFFFCDLQCGFCQRAMLLHAELFSAMFYSKVSLATFLVLFLSFAIPLEYVGTF